MALMRKAGASPESLVSVCLENLGNAQMSERHHVAYLLLLNTWLGECPFAVKVLSLFPICEIKITYPLAAFLLTFSRRCLGTRALSQPW